MSITYIDFETIDFDELLNMSQKLWSDYDTDELTKLLKQTVQSKKNRVLLAKTSDRRTIGFSIFSIRSDYVEGANKSPTGYLEGIFVEPDFRKMGIAKQFLCIGESWCKENACTQIGSDTWLTNKESREFHKKLGFWEEEEIVHFLKDIS